MTMSIMRSKRFSKGQGRFWKRVPNDVRICLDDEPTSNPKHFFSSIITDSKTGNRILVSDLSAEEFIKTAAKVGL